MLGPANARLFRFHQGQRTLMQRYTVGRNAHFFALASDRKSTRLNSSHANITPFPYTTLFRSESHASQKFLKLRVRSHFVPFVIKKEGHMHIAFFQCLAQPMQGSFGFTKASEH